ncbi:zinc transporter ZIP5 [Rhinophrynus dorsalis]
MVFQVQEIPALDGHLRALCSSWVWVQHTLRGSMQRQKRQADRRRLPAPTFQVGERVWLSSWNLNLQETFVHRTTCDLQIKTNGGSAQQGGTSSIQNLNSSRYQSPEQALLARAPQDKDNSLYLQEAVKEHGYYLKQLFQVYGENDTLTYHGLTLLLQNLGLGKVQVVEIQHTELGHDHVSHLDILDVQDNKHRHVHSSQDHTEPSSTTFSSSSVDVSPDTPHLGNTEQPMSEVTESSRIPYQDGKRDTVNTNKRQWSSVDFLEHVLQLHHSSFTHQHEDCLNVTQLLLNFGLQWVSEITPQQFTLLCPALLYQIDSRVCIQHSDQLAYPEPHSQQELLQVLGWGALAVTLISAPSLLAVALVPFLRRPLFRYLLRFLVAVAVGTLCGDALLHLLPHAQEDHSETKNGEGSHPIEPVLKGLCVLGGLYLLFLIENLMGLLRQRQQKKKISKKQMPAQDEVCTTMLYEIGHTADPEFCEVSRAADGQQNSSDGQTGESRKDKKSHTSTHHSHSGHSHSVAGGGGIAEIIWMVLLGDGIHNFTDGLAIGAAFSAGFSGGLSTTVAVFCHELPHELGDFAVLLQSGVPVRRVLFFSLVSAFLSYLGMVFGAVASQSSTQVTPWIFATTAGIFLYVALVDMLPQMLHRETSAQFQAKDFIIHSFGFLLGGAIMLCIALFQDQMVFLDLK